MIAAKDTEVRQGLYKEYSVDKGGQTYENAEGTFKTKGAYMCCGVVHVHVRRKGGIVRVG